MNCLVQISHVLLCLPLALPITHLVFGNFTKLGREEFYHQYVLKYEMHFVLRLPFHIQGQNVVNLQSKDGSCQGECL